MNEQFIDTITTILTFLAGWTLAIARDWYNDYRRSGESARYTAVFVTCTLEKFISRCNAIVLDDGGQPDSEGNSYPEEELPEPIEFPNNLDWKFIDPKTLYEILRLPAEIDHVNTFIHECIKGRFGGDLDEIIELRQYQYASPWRFRDGGHRTFTKEAFDWQKI